MDREKPSEFSQFVVANPGYAWNPWQYGMAARHLAETDLDGLPKWLDSLPESASSRVARELGNPTCWLGGTQFLRAPDDYAPLFEKLPAKYHGPIVESAVDRIMWSDQLADFAKSLPAESLRQIARQRIEAAQNLTPADRARLIEQVRP